jgi:predicted DNA-binding transcriptional regulator AlpA
MSDRLIIPSDELRTRKGITLGEKQLRRLEDAQEFPRRVRISAKTFGYVEAEIDQYVKTKIAQRSTEAA